MMWWLLGAFFIGTPLLLYWLGRRNERKATQDWELVLTPRGSKQLTAVDERLHAELELADIMYKQAEAARSVGENDEALRLLDTGCDMIVAYCPTAIAALRMMANLAGMVAAMAPVRPLVPGDFRLRQLASLAFMERFLHDFLATTKERFQIHVAILTRGFRVVAAIVTRSRGRLRAHPGGLAAEWRQLEAAHHDAHVLTDKSLESLRVLLMSMGAARR